MTVKEPGKNLTPQQTRLNCIVEGIKSQLDRVVDALVAVRPNELLALCAVLPGRDIVLAQGGPLIQLPSLFDDNEDHDYLWLSDIVTKHETKATKLNVYFVYQVFGPQHRTPVCMLAVKKTTETMADLRFYSLNQRKMHENDTNLATVTLGDELALPIMGLRSHKKYVVGEEPKLFEVIDSLYASESIKVYRRNVSIWIGKASV